MASIWRELRKRNVFKVAVAYAVVAWLIAQVVAVVHAPLGLPDWFDSTVIVLLIIGFPLTLIMAWAYELTPGGIKASGEAAPAEGAARFTGQSLNFLILGLLVSVVMFLVVDQYVLQRQETVQGGRVLTAEDSERPVRRSSIILGTAPPFSVEGLNAEIALSNDGHRLAYAVDRDGVPQIYLRELDQLTAQVIPGTEGAGGRPFFSPDGDSVGFTSGEELHHVSVRGGPVRTMAVGRHSGTGAFWTDDDSILFTADTPDGNRLHRIAAQGGVAEPLDLASDDSELTHSWPFELPGGEHVLYSIRPRDGNISEGRVALLSLETGKSQTVIEGAYNARYAPTGHIVFMRSAALWAVPFDPERLVKTGPEIPVVDGVQTYSVRGESAYAFSDDGLLVYLPGTDTIAVANASLAWVDRDGREELLDIAPQGFFHPRISPDGRQLAITIMQLDGTETSDVWTVDLSSGVLSRRTFTGAAERPLWTPDGDRLVYESNLEDGGVWAVAADGSGQPERITTEGLNQRPLTITPDGTLIYANGVAGFGPWDLYVLSMDDTRTDRLLAEEFFQGFADISPNGRWLAYASTETGQFEIFVTGFPDLEGKWQITYSGANVPRWGSDGRELYYRRDDGSVMAVSVETESVFTKGATRLLFPGDDYPTGNPPSYDVSDDGRFLMLKSVGDGRDDSAFPDSDQVSLVIVENWFAELKRLAPPDE